MHRKDKHYNVGVNPRYTGYLFWTVKFDERVGLDFRAEGPFLSAQAKGLGTA